MAKAFPFSPGFVAWGFELSPEFEPQPERSAPEDICELALADPFRFSNFVLCR
jgi:hypothetical protein